MYPDQHECLDETQQLPRSGDQRRKPASEMSRWSGHVRCFRLRVIRPAENGWRSTSCNMFRAARPSAVADGTGVSRIERPTKIFAQYNFSTSYFAITISIRLALPEAMPASTAGAISLALSTLRDGTPIECARLWNSIIGSVRSMAMNRFVRAAT